MNLNSLRRLLTPSNRYALMTPGLVLCLMFPFKASAASEEAIQQLFANTNLSQQIEQLAMGLQAQIASQAAATANQVPPEKQDLMSAVASVAQQTVQTNLSPPHFETSVKQELSDQFSDDEVSEIISWQSSDLVKKISQYEMTASDPANAPALMQYIQKLQMETPRADRVELIQKLDQSINMSKKQVDQAILTGAHSAFAISNTLSCGSGPTLEQVMQNYEQQRPMISQQMTPMVEGSLMYTYRFVRDSELKEYVQQYSQPTIKKFNQLVMDSMEPVLVNFASAMGEQVAGSGPLADKLPCNR